MRKKIIMIMVMFLMFVASGCAKQPANEPQVTPTPETTPEVKPTPTPATSKLFAQGDLTFCRNDVCTVIEKSVDGGVISGWMTFLNALNLEETTLGEQSLLTVLSFDEHEVTFYEQDLVQIDDVVYMIKNADELRESKHGYKFEQISAELIPVSDYVTSSSLKKICIDTGYADTSTLEIEFKDTALKKEFVESLNELVIVDPGFPVYGAGGYSYLLRLNNGYIEENNGVTLFMNNEHLTTKQASCFNGSISGLIVEMLVEQGAIASEDEISLLFEGFETDKIKGYPVSAGK